MFQKAQRRGGVLSRSGWAALTILLILASAAPAAEPWSALIDPDNSLSFSFLRDDRPVFRPRPRRLGAAMGLGRDASPGRRPRTDDSRPAFPSSSTRTRAR